MKLTINIKLLGAFLLLILMACLSAFLSLNSLNEVNLRLNNIVEVSAEKIKLAARINQGVIAISRAEKNIILATSQNDMDEFSTFIEDTQKDMQMRRQQLRLLVDDEGKVQLDKFSDTWSSYLKTHRELRNIARLNSNVRARNLSQEDARDAYDAAAATMAQIVEKNDQEVDAAQKLSTMKNIAERIKLAARINRNLVEIQRGEKNLILAKSQQEMDDYANAIKLVRKDLEDRLEQLEALATGEEKSLIKRFSREFQSYFLQHENVRKLSRENANVRAFDLSSGKARELNDKAYEQMAAIVDKNEQDLALDTTKSDLNYNSSKNLLLTLTFASILVGAVLAFWIIQGINKGLAQIKNIVTAVSEGNTQQQAVISGNDEVADVLHLINRMVNSLQDVTEITQSVAQKDFSQSIKVKGPQDVMGQSINTMTEYLRQISQENEQLDWLKSGQNALNDQIRGELDEVKLAENIIQFLASYLEAQVGTVYLLEDNENSKVAELKLVGSYAFSQRTELNSRITIGEGLVGQAAYERKLISVTQLPDEYTRIQSSIGTAIPRNAVVVPFLYEQKTLGVIELAALQEFSEHKLELLSSVMENISLAFVATRARDNTFTLLQESQRQGEEMKSQQEELQKANNELEEQTLLLKASEEELKQQSEELSVANEDLKEKTINLKAQQTHVEAQKTALQASTLNLEHQTEELKQANKYKSEFLSNMSHELRTPLNSMLLLTESLVDNKEGNLNADQIESAKVIHSGGKELAVLINEILDLSKIEAGKMQLNIESVRFDHLTDRLSKQFAPLAKNKQLNFETSIEPGISQLIETDAQRLLQILKNLLSNAFKFTHTGTIKLNIATAKAEANLFRLNVNEQNVIALSVTDTGIGIPEAKRVTIFESFQQADGGISRNYGGTGLGLTISRELAKLLGGELALENSTTNDNETGSTFTLYLPISFHSDNEVENNTESSVIVTTPAANKKVTSVAALAHENDLGHEDGSGYEKQSADKSESDHQYKTTRGSTPFYADDRTLINADDRSLLIIEDDVHFAGALAKLAQSRDYRCLVTDSGKEGLKLAEQYLPNGIVLDLGLPDADGAMILEQLKGNIKTRHIPVHIVSARDPDVAIMKKGAAGHLTKPVSTKDLETLIAQLKNSEGPKVNQILIVEDDAGSQAAIKELIYYQGIEITMTSTGEEALEHLASNPFDCVILDLRLPDMTGFEVIEQLSDTLTGDQPPVIVYTGADLNEEENKKLEQLASSVVLKGPGSGDRLIDDLALFLHSTEKSLPAHHREVINTLHDPKLTLQGHTVLIVDDDVRNIFALGKVLAEAGLDVQSADNGKVGLEKLAQDPLISLVIMDIMMPVMDGLEAMRKIRAQAQYRELPIIALTAKATPEDRENCLAAGANDYMSKPVDREQILTLIKVWLHGKSA